MHREDRSAVLSTFTATKQMLQNHSETAGAEAVIFGCVFRLHKED